ncbi:MAG: GxxExxY protein [Acidimicrobiia bacterium]|nr:GxxExxY protein [Acidimicrobiia bacterium]
MTNDELTEKIIGCAFRVHNTLGPGYAEKVYENSMRVALTRERVKVRQQAPILVYFDGEVVGEFVPDLWVEDRVFVEIKAVLRLQKEHE